MVEKFERTPQLSADSLRAHDILSWLGLSFNDLKGKKTLDVGAGNGGISAEAERHGIFVVAVDSQTWEDPRIKEGASYVVGNARQLPFESDTFDFVLAHAAPPLTWTDNKELVAATLTEYWRVLKPGGEIRFGSGTGTLPRNLFENLFKGVKQKLLPELVKHKRTQAATFDVFKSMYPDIKRHTPTHEVHGSPHQGYYYVLKKPLI